MTTIWKYEIPAHGPFRLEMPQGARVLCVQMQDRQPCLWAIVDTEADLSRRYFYIAGTGAELPEDTTRYVGTFQVSRRSPEESDQRIYVWHLFEVE